MAEVAAPTSEIGYVNGASWWNETEFESAPELMWPRSVEIFDKMRRTDSQVASVLRAVTLPVRRTEWRVDPAGCKPEVAQLVADDLGLQVQGAAPTRVLRTKDRFDWDEHLRLALLMLPFGHSVFEQVYRVGDDGYAHLRKLGYRPPRSISRFNVATDGGLISIQQDPIVRSGGTSTVTIPVDRLVVYVHDREGGNWHGLSVLRSAYKNWIIKDRLLRVQAQTVERNGMGVPRYTGAENETDLTAGKKLATSWRSDAAAGSAIAYGAKLDLVGVTGTLPDADTPIRYHDEQIARAVLAHFLNLGTQTGSWALGTTFADFFSQSLQTIAQQIAQTATQHIIEDLVDINFGPTEPAPQLVFDEIGSRQALTAEALKVLRDAGVLIPDRTTEEAVRQIFGLPAKDAPSPTPTPPPGGAA